MPATPLSPVEARVLGCLLEKERLTPDVYPLSLNALVAACNQSTAREPVMGLGEKEVEAALETMRFEHKLATVVFGAGSRVQKYRHNLGEIYQLSPGQVALLTVLLLRGPQTPGELRARTERFAAFTGGTAEVESTLEALAAGEEPLVRVLPARPGQKERRFVQLLTGEPVLTEASSGGGPGALESGDIPGSRSPDAPSRLETLETEVRELRAELTALREAFAAFRQQFE